MSLFIIHAGLSNTGSLFMAALAIWAIYLRIRTQPLNGNWYGAAVMGEILLIAQFIMGWLLYFQLNGGALPRTYLHILYGLVAILTLPAGYSYFGNLEDENVKTVAMAAICIFLWGIIMRASGVATTPFVL